MRDAVTAMVGDPLTDQGRDRHPGLRRVAESPRCDRDDPPAPNTPDA